MYNYSIINENDSEERILLSHGDGGLLTAQLIRNVFLSNFNNEILVQERDAAYLPHNIGTPAVTTDSFVITPLFFPGGDIGKLAVCGTVNDLAVSGATPKYITAAFIIEEGFPVSTLKKIVQSMAVTSREAGVTVVAGDTKVVAKGNLDGIFINTTGIGFVPPGVVLDPRRVRPGDHIIINGGLGEHGIAVIARREGFDISVQSDCAALSEIIQLILKNCSTVIKFMRDPTRGGVATALKEIAVMSGVDLYIDENALPVKNEVKFACDILGLDPLYLANEGKFLAVVEAGGCMDVLNMLHNHSLGQYASCIGEVKEGTGNVFLKTAIGGTRRLELYAGSVLPRIC